MHRQCHKILLLLCFLLSFGPRASSITACKEYINFLFGHPKVTELGLREPNENVLKNLGFKESYTLGFDRAKEHLRLAEKLRSLPIDPWKTHIEEFADLVEPHLNHVERGIRSQDAPDKLERLVLLENFRAEARQWIERRELTYRRWVNLNFRLSILATPKDKRMQGIFMIELHASEDWYTDVRLESFYRKMRESRKGLIGLVEKLDLFPKVIIVPQKNGILGTMALTRMTARRVYLHSLENKTIKIHNELHYPDGVFWHDSIHMSFHEMELATGDRYLGGSYEEIILPFHNAFFLHIQGLPKKEQEMLNLLYYDMIFETPQSWIQLYWSKRGFEISKYIIVEGVP